MCGGGGVNSAFRGEIPGKWGEGEKRAGKQIVRKFKGYRPARLDQSETSIIAKVLFRPSTAIYFIYFHFDLKS
jgi:hypothetical protein